MTQAHPTTGATVDPDCPVSLELLGEVYRADEYDLPYILEKIPPLTRAKLAAYLYGKSHMHQLGLKVARACERDDLVRAVGEIGAVIYGQSHLKPAREPETPAPTAARAKPGAAPGQKKISLGGSAAKGRGFDFD
ncbi:hypothetical protein [Methylobacterium organophilum]|uniref:Uncharacterized protein n=1 Tax=Methylobacterium organophilum TaxID=410 RepID=A0ABQ4T632_METOR|nr:hypothetical protein [Methylobacterium organophilum]UMY16400.1 hypothetical protein MMB17_17045 [Methylobacterium organophilum]GJE27117.1 hypothetical protein LKMONMHP_1973 [Methylobacterium organophilum]